MGGPAPGKAELNMGGWVQPEHLSAEVKATGRSATFVVAADDSSALAKQQADYVCDGADDQVEIQAAIDSLSDRGGLIWLTGNFYISDTIHLYRDVASWFCVFLQGEGLSATRISLENGSNCNMIDNVVLDNDSGWKGVADMTLDGNKSNQTSGHGIYTRAIGAGVQFDMRVRNVFAYSMKETGFRLYNAWGVYLDNCLAEYCEGDGLYMIGAESYIYGFHSSQNGETGIYLRGNELHLSNCRIDSVDSGIKIYELFDSVIANNTIATFGIPAGSRIGIEIGGDCKNTIIHDNVINGDSANSMYGVYAYAPSTHPLYFHDNIITGCINNSLLMDSITTNFKCANNVMSDLPTTPVAHGGTIEKGNIVIGNIGINPLGVVASPFDNTNFKIGPLKSGLAASPNTASQDYASVITPCRVISTGGTDVSIVIKDAAGTTINSLGATCDEELEIGWSINFGSFSAAPTVLVAFK